MRYPAFRLLPDFWPSAFIMGAPIGVVVVLIGIEILSRRGCKQLASFDLRAIASLAGIGFDDPGAITLQNMFAFAARITRQTERHAVTKCGAEHGEGNAGVAAGGVENGFSLIQETSPLGIHNHCQGRTILH